jgi:hypothetical protein
MENLLFGVETVPIAIGRLSGFSDSTEGVRCIGDFGIGSKQLYCSTDEVGRRRRPVLLNPHAVRITEP